MDKPRAQMTSTRRRNNPQPVRLNALLASICSFSGGERIINCKDMEIVSLNQTGEQFHVLSDAPKGSKERPNILHGKELVQGR